MGTTTAAVGVLGDHVYVSQVGDSRAYLIRNGQGVQLTKDQSLMQRLVEAGELTEEEAAQSERRNIILQALGPDAKVKVDLTYQEVRRGDPLGSSSVWPSWPSRKATKSPTPRFAPAPPPARP